MFLRFTGESKFRFPESCKYTNVCSLFTTVYAQNADSSTHLINFATMKEAHLFMSDTVQRIFQLMEQRHVSATAYRRKQASARPAFPDGKPAKATQSKTL